MDKLQATLRKKREEKKEGEKGGKTYKEEKNSPATSPRP